MKTRWILVGSLLVVLMAAFIAGPSKVRGLESLRPAGAVALGTAFTYQGRLTDNGSPANGTYDFEFKLYDAASGGTQVGSTVTQDDVSVSGGLFTVPLDFGNVFNGDALWLEIGVRPGSSTGAYTTLSPRQALTAAPYAFYALNNWSLTGNSGTTAGTNFLGTTDNQALEFKVNGARALRIEPNATSPNLIGGYSGNTVTTGAVGATISGGGNSTGTNSVTDNYGTVGGGVGNRAGDNTGTTSDAGSATVGGGANNIASGGGATIGGGYGNTASALDATVAGGFFNTANSSRATIGGGANNTASNSYATVGGGGANTASGYAATVAGGLGNTADGDYGFAAGQRAKANNAGCFVWGDSTDVDVTCSTNNMTIFRSTGGFSIYTSVNTSTGAPTSGVQVATGGNAWSTVSDRASKENFRPVDTRLLLARLAEIPITTWNYKSQDSSIRHIGPMAQDFNALLPELGGEGEKYINSLDADGVSLAAIQGLYQMVQEKDAEISNLKSQISALEARLAALEQRTGGPSAPTSGLPVYGLALGAVGLLGVVVSRRRKEGGGQ